MGAKRIRQGKIETTRNTVPFFEFDQTGEAQIPVGAERICISYDYEQAWVGEGYIDPANPAEIVLIKLTKLPQRE